ncbi:MAG: cupin domain-containing protein [candidate division KSB1 bacterium]|nr:cupin domain-containing protein [candidate division KSB1 bacterium]MDZ7335533.1 cupin domain-containing protein [candidate division KSB1 bacterium]MDZ7356900.1 cupin domain-containing protein [candidate division KSB1 bacterium]MDZ7375607.1 cupin domain-containing protein [candidate division KSB1 bacterium]MDZ7399269.1 cupin domain-containing protein [candidate division KSB1 bacterium]
MKIIYSTDLEATPIKDPNVSGVSRRVLISAEDQAPNFTMRLFHVEPGGYTYHHSHDFEHEIYILEGEGEAIGSGGTVLFKAGAAIFVEPNEIHQLRNTGKGTMSFLCLVPNRGHQ